MNRHDGVLVGLVLGMVAVLLDRMGSRTRRAVELYIMFLLLVADLVR